MPQDLRFALRTFAKNPGFTVLAVVVLAIGIGANTAMFTIVNGLMFKALSGDAGEMLGVYSQSRERPDEYRAFSYPNYADIREHTRDLFDGVLAHTFSMVGVGEGDTTRRTFVAVVSSNYFETLNVRLAAGRPFSADEERPGAALPVVIVNFDRWQQAGLDPALVGSTIRINSIDFTVVGVTPRGFTGTMAVATPEMWLPLGMFDQVVTDMFKSRGTGLADRGNHALIVAGRLGDGIGVALASERLAVLASDLERLYPGENRAQTFAVHPLPRLGTSTSPQDDSGPLLIVSSLLMALSAIVLVIACLNIANMLLARGAARRKEIAIRLAVGGGRGRIVRQLLTEGSLLAGVGAVAGMGLAVWSNRTLIGSLKSLLPLTLTLDAAPDANVLAATVAITVVATLLFALGPAFRSSRVDVLDDLKGSAGVSSQGVERRFGARNLLVVAQIALSLTLLCTGGLFARGAIIAAAANPGFSYDHLLLVSIDPAMAGYDEARTRVVHRRAIERLRAVPGVEAAAFVSTVPFGAFHEGMPVEAVGSRQTAPAHSPTYRIISADYFRALGLRMIRGREFTDIEEQSAAAPRVAIVDEQLARRLFPDRDPIGQLVRVQPRGREAGSGNDGEPMEIVGIAPPLRDSLFNPGPEPALYVPLGRNHRANLSIHVRTHEAGDAAQAKVLEQIRRELTAVDARLPVLDLTSMRRFHEQSLELWLARAGGGIVTLFGLVALLLAVAGVYGVKSYVVSQRTREFGIRVAIGARPSDVMWMVLRDGFVLTGTGVVIGLALAALVGTGLSKLLYQVSPRDPLVFTVATATLVVAAMIASWVPARRATRVVPVTALRAD